MFCLFFLSSLSVVSFASSSSSLKTLNLEKKLLSVLNSDALDIKQLQSTVSALETSRGILKPARSNIIDGCWRLLYTGNEIVENASPIQRTVTSLKQVKIYQVVNLNNKTESFLNDINKNNLPDVSNVVCFGGNFRLRVTALGSTIENPLVIPRVGDGKIFGFNIFGVSNNKPPRDIYERIDFAFKEALFESKLDSLKNFFIPYPVPFTLLGDEAKGWIDTTYMSENLRLSRGNKGSLFILQKVNIAQDEDAKWAATNLNRKSAPVQLPAISTKVTTSPTAIAATTSLTAVTTNTEGKASIVSSPSMPSSSPINFLSFFGNNKAKSMKPSPSTKQKVCVILPAQLATKNDYLELEAALRADYACDVITTPLLFQDWILGLAPSFLTKEYLAGTLQPSVTLKFYLEKVDQAVEQILAKYKEQDVEIIIIGHSIGGWIARAWVSEWASYSVRAKVKTLVTLGSPHQPPPDKSIFTSADQTRGMLSYINNKFPGSYEENTRYISVIGSGVEGEVKLNLASIVAYASYLVLSGDGETRGDGVIPVNTAALEGAEVIIIDEAKHSDFIPSPFGSIKLPYVWYGSTSSLSKWASKI